MIGRTYEIKTLNRLYNSGRTEFVAIYYVKGKEVGEFDREFPKKEKLNCRDRFLSKAVYRIRKFGHQKKTRRQKS